jgi:DNA polymerase-3 subunit alpha
LPSLQLEGNDVPLNEKLAWEKELLGTYLSEHPFSRAAQRLASDVRVLCGQIDERMGGQDVATAGILTSVRYLYTKEGRPFASAVLEDLDGRVEITAWPDVYGATKDLWTEGNIVLVEGRVRVRGERVQLSCDNIRAYQFEDTVEELTPPQRHRLLINLAQTSDEEGDVARLHQILDALKDFPGADEVRLRVDQDGDVVDLEFPGLTATYCPELHQRLADLVPQENLLVH